MTIIKISEATNLQLDWAVAACEGQPVYWHSGDESLYCGDGLLGGDHEFAPSTNWVQGGPIIERERVHIRPNQGDTAFKAFVVIRPTGLAYRHDGPTPLIAAMRCYVANKLGEEIEIPEDLK